MKAKKTNYAGVVALLLIGAAGVYGLGLYIRQTPEAAHVPASLRRPEPNHDRQSRESDRATRAKATVLTPKSSGGDLSFESATEDVPQGTSPIVFAVNRYLENSHITPPQARALTVDVKDGVAYISFTPAMDQTYGSSDEQALLQGISKTLEQFPDLHKFLMEVNGQAIQTLGNVDTSQPLEIKPVADDSTKHGA